MPQCSSLKRIVSLSATTGVGPENLVGRQDHHNKGQSWCTGTSLRDAGVARGQSADLGDAHCPDGEPELPGLEDEVHGGPDAAAATSKASGLEEGLSSD
jgi:hypothetical protein